MSVIKNELIEVEMDIVWPRITKMKRNDSNGIIQGCDREQTFALELNDRIFSESEITVNPIFCEAEAKYEIEIPAIKIKLNFVFSLEGQEIVFTITDIKEEGECKLEKLYIPEHCLITGTAKNGDSYLRNYSGHVTNWSRDWCPGTQWNSLEDYGLVSGGTPELGFQKTGAVCIWNEGICVSMVSSAYSDPFVSILDKKGQLLSGRAGRFSAWAGTYHHRLIGKLAAPFELRIGLLGDYNKNGKIDWCDAAAWVGDKGVKGKNQYEETLIYKLYVDDARIKFPLKTFEECLEIIKQIHHVSGGTKQIAYLVGWQYEGHDTGYPSIDKVNERIGGIEGLRKLMTEAKEYNCIVSLHINLDDSYEGNPEFRRDILGGEADGHKHLWYHNFENGGKNVYSINHTLSVESGYEKDRLERLLKLLPIKESIHCDAHRINETWTTDGTHINAECEAQFGMIKIKEMYLEKGIDITTEFVGADSHGTYKWGFHMSGWQGLFGTVMSHGRVSGHIRYGLEGEGLGRGAIWNEKEMDSYETTTSTFYLNWMYAQILYRKKMVEYKIGAWTEGVEAWYEDNTYIRSGRGGHKPIPLKAIYEGIEIARGNERFLPWREDTIFFYSEVGGEQEWILPASWKGCKVEAVTLRRAGQVKGPEFTIEGTTIKFYGPRAIPVKFIKK